MRKEPPLAVMISFLICLYGLPAKHCAMAECSLSIGVMIQPFSKAALLTSSPPTTNVSLFAKATLCFVSKAFKVGSKPDSYTHLRAHET